MHFDLSMQKEFDIKWKSHDISGSASLALWANMNQSTTPLGSKRQSQGKHPYPTINIFICCCVSIICPVNIYFYVFYFSVIFFFVLRRFIFYFIFLCLCLNCSFSPRWFSCLQPSWPCWVCLKSLWCSSLLYVLFPLKAYIKSLSGYSLAWTSPISSLVGAGIS